LDIGYVPKQSQRGKLVRTLLILVGAIGIVAPCQEALFGADDIEENRPEVVRSFVESTKLTASDGVHLDVTQSGTDVEYPLWIQLPSDRNVDDGFEVARVLIESGLTLQMPPIGEDVECAREHLKNKEIQGVRIIRTPTRAETVDPITAACDPDRIDYLEIGKACPAQTRISDIAVKCTKNDHLLKYPDGEGGLDMRYDEGRSCFPLNKTKGAVWGPGTDGQKHLVILDGHHTAVACSMIDPIVQTYPYRIEGDLSHLAVEKFWEEMEARGWALVDYSESGERIVPPHSFAELKNDHNRCFVGKGMAFIPQGGDRVVRPDVGGTEFPLFVELEQNEVPFIEFHIAKVLQQKGFTFVPEEGWNPGEPPSDEMMAKAREILINSGWRHPRVAVVKERKHWSELTFDDFLLAK
jgi:hypothetical protein